MTLDSLTQDIAQAERELHLLNRRHFREIRPATEHRNAITRYETLGKDEEQRMCELAERLARLRRFRNLIAARSLSCESAVRTRASR